MSKLDDIVTAAQERFTWLEPGSREMIQELVCFVVEQMREPDVEMGRAGFAANEVHGYRHSPRRAYEAMIDTLLQRKV